MKIILLHVILFFSLISIGQIVDDTSRIVINNALKKGTSIVSFADKYKIGFYLGYGVSNYCLKTKDISQTIFKDSLSSVKSGSDFSTMEFGVYVENSITNQIAIRSKLVMLYDAVNLNYNKPIIGNEKSKIESLSLTLPIHVIFQTKGTKTRGYFLCGPSFTFGSSYDTKTSKKSVQTFDIPLEVGIGFYKRLKKFFVSPEIKFSQGLFNLNRNHPAFYSQAIDKLARQNIIFALTLSGH